MKEWQQRKRAVSTYDTGGSSTANDSNVTLPLSQGEWDEPLGLPLCVVCHGVRILEFSSEDLANIAVSVVELGLTNLFARPTKSTPLR